MCSVELLDGDAVRSGRLRRLHGVAEVLQMADRADFEVVGVQADDVPVAALEGDAVVAELADGRAVHLGTGGGGAVVLGQAELRLRNENGLSGDGGAKRSARGPHGLHGRISLRFCVPSFGRLNSRVSPH